VVSKGDTLWSIASELNGNIRENIYEIKKINNLKTSYIYEGQELQLPIK
jgi:LysM repeat protein